jgi:hypothetical protein
MHFDAQVVDLRMCLRQAPITSPAPKPISRQRGALGPKITPERSVQIDGGIVEIQAVDRPKLGERSFLRCRNAAGA